MIMHIPTLNSHIKSVHSNAILILYQSEPFRVLPTVENGEGN